MQGAMVLVLRAYQRFLSPVLSRRLCCRFYPTCSEYAVLAIEKYGTIRGMRLTFRRLKRCRPDNLESCLDFP